MNKPRNPKKPYGPKHQHKFMVVGTVRLPNGKYLYTYRCIGCGVTYTEEKR